MTMPAHFLWPDAYCRVPGPGLRGGVTAGIEGCPGTWGCSSPGSSADPLLQGAGKGLGAEGRGLSSLLGRQASKGTWGGDCWDPGFSRGRRGPETALLRVTQLPLARAAWLSLLPIPKVPTPLSQGWAGW